MNIAITWGLSSPPFWGKTSPTSQFCAFISSSMLASWQVGGRQSLTIRANMLPACFMSQNPRGGSPVSTPKDLKLFFLKNEIWVNPPNIPNGNLRMAQMVRCRWVFWGFMTQIELEHIELYCWEIDGWNQNPQIFVLLQTGLWLRPTSWEVFAVKVTSSG